MRTFEDLEIGHEFELGSYTVTEEEILEFGRRYDPQPFHTDPEAAGDSVFGGLIASGWLTAAIFMRLYYETVLADADGRGSPGVEDLRWRAPVRPGDTLSGTIRVEDKAPSATTPGRGTVVLASELRNQDGTTVLTLRARGLFGMRG